MTSTGATYAERRFGPRWTHLAARWSQTVPRHGGHRQLVLPDGCADVILVGDTALVVGPTARRDLVDLPGGTVVRGLRMRPGAAGAVLGTSAAELRDRVVPLDAVVPRAVASALVRVVAGDLAAARRLEERPPPRAREALAALAGGESVGVTARTIGFSERQLRRVVLDHAGLGPKALQRVFRLQRFLALADVGARAGLARLAADAGYADQAHLARDVRELAGVTPRALLAHRAGGDPEALGLTERGRNVQEPA